MTPPGPERRWMEGLMEEVESKLPEVESEAAEGEGAQEDAFADVRKRYEDGGELADDDLDRIADLAVSYLRSILAYFGETAVTIDEYDGDEGELILDVSGGDLAVLIGRHGSTLDALQTIVATYMSNQLKFHFPIVVDVEGYKNRRKQKLVSLAKGAAAKAKRTKAVATLAPMNAYERRIVHLTLMNDDEVSTHSEGEEPHRHVVVTYVR